MTDAQTERAAVVAYIEKQVAEADRWGTSLTARYILHRLGEEIERGEHVGGGDE